MNDTMMTDEAIRERHRDFCDRLHRGAVRMMDALVLDYALDRIRRWSEASKGELSRIECDARSDVLEALGTLLPIETVDRWKEKHGVSTGWLAIFNEISDRVDDKVRAIRRAGA